MENIKTFMNIGFVILCLALLWFLFTADGSSASTSTNNSRRSLDKVVNNTPRSSNPYVNERDFDERYSQPAPRNYTESIRKDNRSYGRESEYAQPKTESKKGILDKWLGGNDKTTNRVIEEHPRNPRDDQFARDILEGDRGIEYEKPYYKEDLPPPPPVANNDRYTNDRYTNDRYAEQQQQQRQPAQQYDSGEIVGREKRFSRDGKLGTYRGPMRGGSPHGFAIFEYDNGDMYVGEYHNGARTGFGNSIFKKQGKIQLRKYSNGEKLMNKNIKGVRYGNMAFVHGGVKGTYYGPMRDRQPHGFGYFQYKNGDMYIGSYQKGKRNGAGNLIFANGDVLFLEYRNGKELNRSANFN